MDLRRSAVARLEFVVAVPLTVVDQELLIGSRIAFVSSEAAPPKPWPRREFER